MEKTDLQKQFEEEQDSEAVVELFSFGKVYLPAYSEWCERKALKLMDKAEAYDRLMSGGKKTLKEWASIFGTPVAVDKNLSGIVFYEIPELLRTVEEWRALHGYVGIIPSLLIDYSGDWEDSLTLPDGWEEEE